MRFIQKVFDKKSAKSKLHLCFTFEFFAFSKFPDSASQQEDRF